MINMRLREKIAWAVLCVTLITTLVFVCDYTGVWGDSVRKELRDLQTLNVDLQRNQEEEAASLQAEIANLEASLKEQAEHITKASTIVVAASDSLDRSSADYVCDGIEDNEEIQAGIDALPIAGGKVILLEGEYFLKTSLTINGSGVTLEGVSLAVKLKLTGEANCDILRIGDDNNSCQNIIVRSLYLDGNRENQSIGGSAGIYARHVKNLIVEDCVVEEVLGHGIWLHNIVGSPDGYSSVTGCTVADTEFDNDGKGIAIEDSKYINVLNNIIINPKSQGIWGGEAKGADFVNVIGNSIVGAGQAGIMPSYNSTNWNIQGNTISGCIDGITINSPGNHTVCGNNIECLPGASAGIYVTSSPVTITGNTIKGAQKYGIWVTSHYSALSDIVISNNLVIGDGDNTENGIRLRTDDDNLISNVIVQGNICKNAYHSGIGVYGAYAAIRDIMITENRCYDDQSLKTQQYGIETDGDVDYCLIEGNDCRGNAVNDGILTVGANDIVIGNFRGNE